ncbi:hypothetical protein COCNU_scaffold061390G000010 [Cocos nucifera]|nr:hypothetical protein [Cocos nucifera]
MREKRSQIGRVQVLKTEAAPSSPGSWFFAYLRRQLSSAASLIGRCVVGLFPGSIARGTFF